MAGVVLKAGAEKAVRRRHPWLFSGAIAYCDEQPASGETVDVLADDGTWLARGAWSPTSQIRVRLWTWREDEPIDAAWLRARVARALAARGPAALDAATACRLVHAESDGLPGIVVDRYADVLVLQLLSAGAEVWRDALVAALRELVPGAATLYERSDVDVREKEGLPPVTGLLAGAEPPPLVTITESAYRFLVDVRAGHKTGFYLDQRDNRAAVAALAAGREVLNCFSYTGGFGVAALAGGAARVTDVETSAPALALARQAHELNGLDAGRYEQLEGDVFRVLRTFRDSRRRFDLIVLDPPKFAESKHQLEGAARGYKDINLLACKLLRPGGLLVTFSCSGVLDRELFQKIVADAALDAGRDAQIVARLAQGADHPVALTFPEGDYLKGLVCRMLD
jgi:23S rRNA (cytosine1962-C5)-methyltransferase